MYSVFRLRRTDGQWLEDSGSVFLTWHVFNPNGPTVNCVGWRETGADEQREVFWRWMHFTGGEDYCLGYVDAGDPNWGSELLEVLTHAFSLPTGGVLERFPLVTCVPYAVTCLLDEAWQERMRQLLASTEALGVADWGRERYYLQRYGARLFDRAGEEYREAYEKLKSAPENANSNFLELTWLMHQNKPTFIGWTPGAFRSRAIEPGDLEAWWTEVTSEAYLVPALGQLAQAWVGASLRAPASESMTRTRFDDVSNFLAHYRHPLWPEQWSTESIARSMGLRVEAEDAPDE